jgi:RNA ligase
MDKLNIKLLEQYREDGWIKCQKHSSLNLIIWNYTEKTQFTRKWDAVTNICRGLITDDTGKIVGRSFDKFHNYEEQELKEAKCVRIFNKADGSLGILFNYNGEWIFTSRGSFESPQAIKGRSMIPDQLLNVLDPSISYVFEIIFPENRIVVNYGTKECLIFLAAFKTDGTEIHELIEDGNKIPIFDFMTNHNIETIEEYTALHPELVIFEDLKTKNIPNMEGYVVLIGTTRIKIKFENYKDLHKMKSNLNVKTVFELIRIGTEFEKILETIPDENHEWFRGLLADVTKQWIVLKQQIKESYSHFHHDGMSRKDFAMIVNKMNPKFKPFMFKLLDHKSIDEMIYDLIDLEQLEKKHPLIAPLM